MCVGGSAPSIPAPPPPPPPPPPIPTKADPQVTEARNRTRSRAALAQGRQSTILTSGLGLTTPASTASSQITAV